MARKSSKEYVCPWTLTVDRREQTPWTFEDLVVGTGQSKKQLKLTTQKGTLKSGDYSIAGYAHRIAIERKSKQDWYGTIGNGRNRFVRELGRLNAMDFAAVIIESEFLDIVNNPPERSKVTPAAAIGNVIAFQQRFKRVHFWMVPGRYVASKVCWKILHRWYCDETGTKPGP